MSDVTLMLPILLTAIKVSLSFCYHVSYHAFTLAFRLSSLFLIVNPLSKAVTQNILFGIINIMSAVCFIVDDLQNHQEKLPQ